MTHNHDYCMHIYIYIYIYVRKCSTRWGSTRCPSRSSSGSPSGPSSSPPSTGRPRSSDRKHRVSCHNFKSQNFKLRVSNPKSKYVAYLSVLSRISNCQSLGRKNKHQIARRSVEHVLRTTGYSTKLAAVCNYTSHV